MSSSSERARASTRREMPAEVTLRANWKAYDPALQCSLGQDEPTLDAAAPYRLHMTTCSGSEDSVERYLVWSGQRVAGQCDKN